MVKTLRKRLGLLVGLALLALVFTIGTGGSGAFAGVPSGVPGTDIQMHKITKSITGVKQSSASAKAARPLAVLYDQYTTGGATTGTSSQDFEAVNDPYDDQAADDFTVPGGTTWVINEVDVHGSYSTGGGPVPTFNVYFYQDQSGLPGTVASSQNATYATGATVSDFNITLATPVQLGPGPWWVSVQARMDFTPLGQWYWSDSTTVSGNPAAWQNPGGGFASGCLSWGVRTNCIPGSSTGQQFRILGATGATPTPPVGATNTPSATNTATATSTATNTPCPGRVQVVSGSIATGDTTQTGRLSRNGIVATCATPKTCAGLFGSATIRYDLYSFVNTNPGTTCYTFDLDATNCGQASPTLLGITYLTSYDPANVCTNYLGDPGSSFATHANWSVNIPGGATFLVWVGETAAGANCATYTLSVDGFPCTGGTPLPTYTPTNTRTSTATRTPTVTPTCPPVFRSVGKGQPGEAVAIKNAKGANRLATSGQSKPVQAGNAGRDNAPIDFILDDGSAETSIGFGTSTTETAAIWLNRFTPPGGAYPVTLSSISIDWPSQSTVTNTNLLIGKTPTLLVYNDTDGDGNPANATLLYSATVTINVTDTFQVYPVTVVVPGAGDVYIGFKDAWAENGYTPRLFPAAIDQSPPSQVRSWIIAQSTDTRGPVNTGNLGANDIISTIDTQGLPGNWLIRAGGISSLPDPCQATRTSTPAPTFTSTATLTPTPGNILIGHVTLQGITQPNTRNVTTATLQLCVSGVSQSSVVNLDSQAFFTVTTTLPNGTYNYQIKSYRNLANSGSFTFAGGTTGVEMGTLKAGDSNNSNNVNSTDFNQLKAAFGTANNLNTDFNRDGITNSTDFNLLKGNFGLAGNGLTCP